MLDIRVAAMTTTVERASETGLAAVLGRTRSCGFTPAELF
jgi:hypothetical protein